MDNIAGKSAGWGSQIPLMFKKEFPGATGRQQMMRLPATTPPPRVDRDPGNT
jgi:hypothetical protein